MVPYLFMKEVKVRKALTKEEYETLGGHSEIVKDLLFHRGVRTKEDAEKFLNPDYETGRHDPYLFKDMEKSVERFLKAIKENETIGIFSDYDADGIPGAVMFQDFMNRIGYEHFHVYIPHRHDEGYGLNTSAIDELKKKGVSLLITIDCGIRDHEHIAYANTKGMDVILTDHHEQGETLPEAFAVLNPKVNDSTYPFNGLCGTGVAFKFIEGILKKDRLGIKEGHEKWLLDMVGLATLSDMVPLVDENRVFGKFGLDVLRKTPRLGLQTLYRKLRLPVRNLSEDDIGFMIAPRINAASRMAHPEDAFHLLGAKDDLTAKTKVEHIESINNERKGLVASIVKEVRKRLSKKEMKEIILIGDPKWRPSVLGLVAGKLADEFSRPAFVWGREGGDTIKGSCRTANGISVVEIMENAKDVFIEFGGHKEAGGFSIHNEKIFDTEEKLIMSLGQLKQKESHEPIYADRTLRLDDVHEKTLKEVLRLAPFGVGNHKPLFLFENVSPVLVRQFGKEKNHLEISFNTNDNRRIKTIGFFMNEESCSTKPVAGKPLNLVAHLEESFWNGRREVRLRIVDCL